MSWNMMLIRRGFGKLVRSRVELEPAAKRTTSRVRSPLKDTASQAIPENINQADHLDRIFKPPSLGLAERKRSVS